MPSNVHLAGARSNSVQILKVTLLNQHQHRSNVAFGPLACAQVQYHHEPQSSMDISKGPNFIFQEQRDVAGSHIQEVRA